MSNNPRELQALYVVTMRCNQAETKFKLWAKSSPHNRISVEGNRIYIFDQNTWQRFYITWPHGFEQLIIWDAWSRRHLT